MRITALLVGTSMLAACGGGGETGVGTAGTTPPPIASTEHTFVKPTQVRTYRANGALHRYQYQTRSLLTPDANGRLAGTTVGQFDQTYAGDATSVRNSNISLTYDPRDAIFSLTIGTNGAGVTLNQRYQDPAHRTDFGGSIGPQFGVPQLDLPGIQYLQIASGETNANFANGRYQLQTPALRTTAAGTQAAVEDAERFPEAGEQPRSRFGSIAPGASPPSQSSTYDRTTFFYQQPGTTTKYVTFAGFLRNNITSGRTEVSRPVLDAAGAPVVGANGQPLTELVSLETLSRYDFTRGVFVFSEQTINGNVPRTGSGSFRGSLLATSVLNNLRDDISISANQDGPTYFQWIEGRSAVDVNFGANTFNIALDGNVHAPIFDFATTGNHSVRGGATFAARGSGQIDLVAAGGFLGQFQQAWFVNPDGNRLNLLIAGSSVDGAFYGPAAEEVGGSFRIVGGTPDERIDILGVFTGIRQ
ncbi:MAG: transferrin-binding protein-like solute binding protein [Sphingorhabdus sp.]|nr:transferrin-binding protein-like solute binding protein [Sphingorhabdus sp.]